MKEETPLDPLAAEALSLAALPPPTDAELRALAAARDGALRGWRRSNARRDRFRRASAGLLVAAAAAAVLVFAPRVLHKAPRGAKPEAAAAWQAPDLDEVWKKAGKAVADQETNNGETAADVLFADPEF